LDWFWLLTAMSLSHVVLLVVLQGGGHWVNCLGCIGVWIGMGWLAVVGLPGFWVLVALLFAITPPICGRW